MIDTGKVKSYKDVCNAVDAILQAEQQSGFELTPPPKPLSKKEKQAVNRIERTIEKLGQLFTQSFNKNGEIVIYQKTNPHKATQLAEKIELIKKSLTYLANDLRKGAIQAQIVA
jgi:exo-beta-1,3-glucanase (GH17 family)